MATLIPYDQLLVATARPRLGLFRPTMTLMTADDVDISVVENALGVSGLSWTDFGGFKYVTIRPDYTVKAQAPVWLNLWQTLDALEGEGIQGQCYDPSATSLAEALATFGETETIRWGMEWQRATYLEIRGTEDGYYVIDQEIWIDGRDMTTTAVFLYRCTGKIRLRIFGPCGATTWIDQGGSTAYIYGTSPAGVVLTDCRDLEVLDPFIVGGSPNCSLARVGGYNVNFRGGYIAADAKKRHETVGFFCGSPTTFPSVAALLGVSHTDAHKKYLGFNLHGNVGNKDDCRIGWQSSAGTTFVADMSHIDAGRDKSATVPFTERSWLLFPEPFGTVVEATCVSYDPLTRRATLQAASSIPVGAVAYYVWDGRWWTDRMVIEDMVVYGDPDSPPEASAITGYGGRNVLIQRNMVYGRHLDRAIGVEFCEDTDICFNYCDPTDGLELETTFYCKNVRIFANYGPLGTLIEARMQHQGYPHINCVVGGPYRLSNQMHSASTMPASNEKSLASSCLIGCERQGTAITNTKMTTVSQANLAGAGLPVPTPV